MPAKRSDDVAEVCATAQRVAGAMGEPIVGYVVMCWSADGTSACKTIAKDGSTIPSILVPDFVRNRLLADRIESWTLDTVNGV